MFYDFKCYRFQIRAGYGRSVFEPHLPIIIGRDVSGEVAAIGTSVKSLRVGQEVFGALHPTALRGTYTDYGILSEDELTEKPSSVSHVVSRKIIYTLTSLSLVFVFSIWLNDFIGSLFDCIWFSVFSYSFVCLLQEASAIPFAALTAWRALKSNARITEGYDFEKLLLSGCGKKLILIHLSTFTRMLLCYLSTYYGLNSVFLKPFSFQTKTTSFWRRRSSRICCNPACGSLWVSCYSLLCGSDQRQNTSSWCRASCWLHNRGNDTSCLLSAHPKERHGDHVLIPEPGSVSCTGHWVSSKRKVWRCVGYYWWTWNRENRHKLLEEGRKLYDSPGI